MMRSAHRVSATIWCINHWTIWSVDWCFFIGTPPFPTSGERLLSSNSIIVSLLRILRWLFSHFFVPTNFSSDDEDKRHYSTDHFTDLNSEIKPSKVCGSPVPMSSSRLEINTLNNSFFYHRRFTSLKRTFGIIEEMKNRWWNRSTSPMSRRFVWFISRSEKEQVEEFDVERCPGRRMIDAVKGSSTICLQWNEHKTFT